MELDGFIPNGMQCNNYIENSMKIVLSLTAHENIECLYDLIDNIKQCFVHYEILILLSITEPLYQVYQPRKFVHVVTRRSTLNIWGTIHLFHQHIRNLRYLKHHRIPYDHFWFVASNEMFIKVIPPNFIQTYGIQLHPPEPVEDYDAYYTKLITTKSDWEWEELCKKDSHFMNYVYTNQLKIYSSAHEGLVLPYTLSIEILEEYTQQQLYEKSVFPGYVMEEIFIPTYLLNKYKGTIPLFCDRWIYHLTNPTYSQIMEQLTESQVSIKPVPRKMDDPWRTIIRNKHLTPNNVKTLIRNKVDNVMRFKLRY